LPVPETDVFETGPIGGQVERLDRVLRRKLAQFDIFEGKTAASPRDVLFNVRSFSVQLIWFDYEAGDVGRDDKDAN